MAVFFLLGFILASYLKLPILAIAILGGILAFLLAFTKDNNNQSSSTNVETAEEEDF